MPCVNLKSLSFVERLAGWLATAMNSINSSEQQTREPIEQDDHLANYYIVGEELYVRHARPSLSNLMEDSQTAENLASLVDSRLKELNTSSSDPNLDKKTSVLSGLRLFADKMLQRTKSARRILPLRTRADLINAESRLGSTIFGPIPDGHQREFFHDQKNVWIWHESWIDDLKQPNQITVRYEIRPSGVYKKIASGEYTRLENEELFNFRKATYAYLKVVKEGLYCSVDITN